MTAVNFVQVPETVLFAVDHAPELAPEVGRGTSRLDIIKHAITSFVLAKKRLCNSHRFGLITIRRDNTELVQHSVTSNIDQFLNCLQQIQPANDPDSSSSEPFNLGDLIAAAAPLLQQQQRRQEQHSCGETELIHGGYLSVPRNNNRNDSYGIGSVGYNTSNNPFCSSSGSGSSPNKVRVILIYARSKLPPPVLVTNSKDDTSNNKGLAIDCLYIHDKPQAGVNAPQEVYSSLEDLVDQLSARAGHHGFVYETTAARIGKLLSSMAMLLSHPTQRLPQSQTKAPVDLATAPLLNLPSDAASTLSGVPIINPSQLGLGLNPTLPQGSAWAKPLGSRSAAGADGSSSSSSKSAALGAWDQGGAAEITRWGLDQQQQQQQDAKPQIPDIIDLWDGPAAAAAAGDEASAPQLTVAVVSSSGAGSSSSGSADVVAGVPATVVQGMPDPRPSYDDTEEGVALGVVMSSDITSNMTSDRSLIDNVVNRLEPATSTAVVGPSNTGSSSSGLASPGRQQPGAAPSRAAAAGRSRVAGTPDAAAPFQMQGHSWGFPQQGFADQRHQAFAGQGTQVLSDFESLGVDEDVSADELEGLQAALMASAIEASQQQQRQQRTRQ